MPNKAFGNVSGSGFGSGLGSNMSPEEIKKRQADHERNIAEVKAARQLFGTWLYLVNPPDAIKRAAARLCLPRFPDGSYKPHRTGEEKNDTDDNANLLGFMKAALGDVWDSGV